MGLACLTVVVVRVGKPLLDLLARQAGPGTDVDLAQPGIGDDRDLPAAGDDLGSLGRTTEVTGVDGVDLDAGERPRQLARLRPAGLVQWRIGVTLEPELTVPVGLAVPDEEEFGHAALG